MVIMLVVLVSTFTLYRVGISTYPSTISLTMKRQQEYLSYNNIQYTDRASILKNLLKNMKIHISSIKDGNIVSYVELEIHE
jgi:hypothetical protein